MNKKTTSQIVRRTYFTVRDFLLDKQVLPSHKDYTRFIILGRSRVGSTLLLRSLQENRHILGFGELFQSNAYRWIANAPRFHGSAKMLSNQYHEHPVLFLQNQIFRQQPKHIEAVGFKLFYYHARSEVGSSVWKYLQSQNNIRVIHIRRRNMLRAILSREKAAKTKSWVKTSSTDALANDAQIKLNSSDCQTEFLKTQREEDNAIQWFMQNPTLEIYYEDLVDSFKNEMTKIQQFLGIEPQMLTPVTMKQANQPLAEAIENYEELKLAFKGTQWSSYFIE